MATKPSQPFSLTPALSRWARENRSPRKAAVQPVLRLAVCSLFALFRMFSGHALLHRLHHRLQLPVVHFAGAELGDFFHHGYFLGHAEVPEAFGFNGVANLR